MLDAPAIHVLLPHACPMVLVDRVTYLELGRSITAIKAVTASELCYQHLPKGGPVALYAYPPSLAMESFGQTAALLWLVGVGGLKPDELLMLTAIRDYELVGSAYPGDVLRHEARIVNVIGDSLFVEGESYVGSTRVASIGSMMAVRRIEGGEHA